jgi:hypothetical protein
LIKVKIIIKSKEKFSVCLEQKVFEVLEMFLRFKELYENIKNSEVKYFIDDYDEIFTKCLDNFSTYSKIDLSKLREAFYEKVGYAFLDFRGNFSKNIFVKQNLVWADKYTQEVLLEQESIDTLNLFDLMTDYSKFIIRNKYDKFFDFQENRVRVFTYSINIKNEESLLDEKVNNIFSKLFNILNNNKTLVSRASVVLLQNYEDNKSNACVLLETKLSPFRQNFDYFHWRCLMN